MPRGKKVNFHEETQVLHDKVLHKNGVFKDASCMESYFINSFNVSASQIGQAYKLSLDVKAIKQPGHWDVLDGVRGREIQNAVPVKLQAAAEKVCKNSVTGLRK